MLCLFTSHGGMARLSLPGLLVTHRDGLPAPACRWLLFQVLTRPDIEQPTLFTENNALPDHQLSAVPVTPFKYINTHVKLSSLLTH